jgi:plasmid stability protein
MTNRKTNSQDERGKRSMHLTVRIEPELRDWLDTRAREQERSVGAEIRRILKAHQAGELRDAA